MVRSTPEPRFRGLPTLALAAVAVGMVLLLGFWVVADAFLIPKRPTPAAPVRTVMTPTASITVGALDPASAGQTVAQLLPPPVAPRVLPRIAVVLDQAGGAEGANVEALVYEMPSGHARGPGRLVSRGQAAVSSLIQGFLNVALDPVVRASPGHWYAFVFQTNQPGLRVTLGTVAGPDVARASLWRTSGVHVSGRLQLGAYPWTAVGGSRVLVLLGS
jgi:hypothetical protein